MILLPGRSALRRGIFAYTATGPYFHSPEEPPLRGGGKKDPHSKTYDDTFRLRLSIGEEAVLYLIYKERFKKPAAKRRPGTNPSGFALTPVGRLEEDTFEKSSARALLTPEERSDAVSVIRPELAHRIESMIPRFKRDKKIARGKDIMRRPGRSAYYRSLGPCRGIKDHAIENAVWRSRNYFLNQRGR